MPVMAPEMPSLESVKVPVMPVISLVPGVETPDVVSATGTKVRVPELVIPPR